MFLPSIPWKTYKTSLTRFASVISTEPRKEKKKKVLRFARKIKFNLITTLKMYVDAQPNKKKKKKLVKNK